MTAHLPLILDGTNDTIFAASMDNLIEYMLELSKQHYTHVQCLKCKYIEPTMTFYTCSQCGHDTGVSINPKRG